MCTTQNMADHAKTLVVFREKFVLWLMIVARSLSKRTWVVDVIRLARKWQTFKAVALTVAIHSRIQVIYHDHTNRLDFLPFHPPSLSAHQGGVVCGGHHLIILVFSCFCTKWDRGWIDEEDFLQSPNKWRRRGIFFVLYISCTEIRVKLYVSLLLSHLIYPSPKYHPL